MKEKIFIVGDSFVEGVGDTEGGWPNRLRHMIECHFEVIVDGLGGRNIHEVKKVAEVNVVNIQPKFLIICVGINDSRRRESLGGLEIEPKAFLNYYRGLIQMARANGVKRCYNLGTSRVDESLVLDYKVDKSHTNEGAEQIDREICHAALESGSVYVPISHLVSAKTDVPTLFDGLHPNEHGHRLIAEAVFYAMSDHGDILV